MSPATTSAPASKPAHGCRNCSQLMRAVSYWEGQAKSAIKKRDELDRTILSMDGGIGHWRRICKEISVLLFERRPDDRKRVAEIVQAAAEREEDVERRIGAARDVLYRLKNAAGVDTPIGQEIHQAWSTL
jgi:hypothetical protein